MNNLITVMTHIKDNFVIVDALDRRPKKIEEKEFTKVEMLYDKWLDPQ